MNYTGNQSTLVYQYDSRGNVTRVKEYEYTRGALEELEGVTYLSFDYENQVWLDEITGEAAIDIAYDMQGNPISLAGLNFEFTNGRQFDNINYTSGNSTEYLTSYKYDDEGIRTARTSWNTTTYYTTENGVITSQYELDGSGNKQNEIIFIYDGEDLTAALYEGEVFYYVKNAMGDVVAINDEDGTALAYFAYDAWGNEVGRTTGDNLTTDETYFATNNPFKYRSYYYDYQGLTEYYLQSRYYEPDFCRFINADIPDIAQQSKGEINGLNLFAYCNNDPVNNVDPTGYKKTLIKLNWNRNEIKTDTVANIIDIAIALLSPALASSYDITGIALKKIFKKYGELSAERYLIATVKPVISRSLSKFWNAICRVLIKITGRSIDALAGYGLGQIIDKIGKVINWITKQRTAIFIEILFLAISIGGIIAFLLDWLPDMKYNGLIYKTHFFR